MRSSLTSFCEREIWDTQTTRPRNEMAAGEVAVNVGITTAPLLSTQQLECKHMGIRAELERWLDLRA